MAGLKGEGGPVASEGNFARPFEDVALARSVAQVDPHQRNGVGAKGGGFVELAKELVGPFFELEVRDGLAAREVKGAPQVKAVGELDAVGAFKKRFTHVVTACKRSQNGFVGVDKIVVVAEREAERREASRVVQVGRGEVASDVLVDDSVVEVAVYLESLLGRKGAAKAATEVVPVSAHAKKAHLGHDREHKPAVALARRTVADSGDERFPPVKFVVFRVDAVFVAVGIVVQRQTVLIGDVLGFARRQGDGSSGGPNAWIGFKRFRRILHGGQA